MVREESRTGGEFFAPLPPLHGRAVRFGRIGRGMSIAVLPDDEE
jgi:hypothetical protein